MLSVSLFRFFIVAPTYCSKQFIIIIVTVIIIIIILKAF